MPYADDKNLEQSILQLTDTIIESAMNASVVSGDQKIHLLTQGVQSVEALCQKINLLLEGRDEHLGSMLNQLLQQKLPAFNLLSSFGTFRDDLDQMVKDGLQQALGEFQTNKPTRDEMPDQDNQAVANESMITFETVQQEIPDVETAVIAGAEQHAENTNHDIASHSNTVDDPVMTAIYGLLGPVLIKRNYLIRGQLVNYYLPEQRVALILGTGRINADSLLAYHCRKAGISLTSIPASHSPAELQHQLGKLLKKDRSNQS